MLSWLQWNRPEPQPQQQQLQLQVQAMVVPTKQVNQYDAVTQEQNLLRVKQNLAEVQNTLVEALQAVTMQGEQIDALENNMAELEMSVSVFKQESKKSSPIIQFKNRVSEFINSVQSATANTVALREKSQNVQEFVTQLQQIQAQIDTFPEPPEGPSEKTIIDTEQLENYINELRQEIVNFTNEIYYNGQNIEQLEALSQELLLESENYKKSAGQLSSMITGSSGNVYWIFILDIIAQLLSLVNITGTETNLAIKIGNIARAFFSLIVLVVSIISIKSEIPTSIIFRSVYILVTWLLSIVVLIGQTVNLVKRPTKSGIVDVIHWVSVIATVIFITVFGVKQYIGGALSLGSFMKGGFSVSGWYLMVVSLLSLVSAGLKLYLAFRKRPDIEDQISPINNITTP